MKKVRAITLAGNGTDFYPATSCSGLLGNHREE
jgi:hypothetical protein